MRSRVDRFTRQRADVGILLVAVGVFILSQVAVVIQIAFCKMFAEPLPALHIVRSQITLFADVQSVKIRMPLRYISCLGLIGCDEIISRRFILAGGGWRGQGICRRRLRTADDIVPLDRVLVSGRGLRIRHTREKQCGVYQWREIGRFQDALPKMYLRVARKPSCVRLDCDSNHQWASYMKSTLPSVRYRTGPPSVVAF